MDNAGFETAKERQRAEARKAWSGSGEAATDRIWFELPRSSAPRSSSAMRPRPPRARSSPC